MKKFILLLLFTTQFVSGQEYLTLSSGHWAYDVEVILFGRQLAQPESLTINNRLSNLDVPIHELLKATDGWPLIKALPFSDAEQSNQWQVPLDGEKPKQQALVWVLLQDNLNHPVINKLRTNPIINPLQYLKWRQPATDFLAPEYVAVTSLNKPELVIENEVNNNDDVDLFIEHETQPYILNNEVHSDYTYDGVIAFSKQKFDHVTVKMNFYRHDPFGQQNSYTIDQKQRIKLGVWQYFDHQQFGVMVKVTAISIEPPEKGA